MQLYCHFSETSCGTKGMIKYSKLTKGWIWNRTMFLVDSCTLRHECCRTSKGQYGKLVSKKLSAWRWVDCPEIEAERHRDDSLQLQVAPSQSSSSERS